MTMIFVCSVYILIGIKLWDIFEQTLNAPSDTNSGLIITLFWPFVLFLMLVLYIKESISRR